MAIEVHGPLFDGRADRALDKFADDLRREISSQGMSEVMTNLDRSIKHPTPYYETQVTVTARSATERSVNDRGVIYGNWLEGTGSRNQTTRFKGYASFRRAAQKTRAEAPMLTALIVARGVAAMGGVGIP